MGRRERGWGEEESSSRHKISPAESMYTGIIASRQVYSRRHIIIPINVYHHQSSQSSLSLQPCTSLIG